MVHMHRNALDDPHGHLVQLALVYGQFLHFVVKFKHFWQTYLKLYINTVFSTLVLDHNR